MPGPKSGKAVNVVKPAEPDALIDADSVNAGEVAEVKAQQIKKQEGKYGTTPVKPAP